MALAPQISFELTVTTAIQVLQTPHRKRPKHHQQFCQHQLRRIQKMVVLWATGEPGESALTLLESVKGRELVQTPAVEHVVVKLRRKNALTDIALLIMDWGIVKIG